MKTKERNPYQEVYSQFQLWMLIPFATLIKVKKLILWAFESEVQHVREARGFIVLFLEMYNIILGVILIGFLTIIFK